MSELSLQGRTALITGARSGPGAAFARRLAADGAQAVDTPLLSELTEEVRQAVLMRIGSGRMAGADELAQVVRFLVGDEASYCTGEVWSASGGYR